MKLWLLRPVDGLPLGDNPWEPYYDCTFGYVIRAESEDMARQLAHENGSQENNDFYGQDRKSNTTAPWLDPTYSTCVELPVDGEQAIIMADERLG
jgi:hypothetical protein